MDGSPSVSGAPDRLLLRVIDAIGSPAIVLDADLKVVAASRAFCERFDASPSEVEQRAVDDLFTGVRDIAIVRDRLAESLSGEATDAKFETELEFRHLGRRNLIVRPRLLASEESDAPLILVCIEDITPLRQAERRAAAQQAVVDVLAEAEDLSEAAPRLLAAFCTALGVDVAELWLPDEDGSQVSLAGFHSSLAQLEPFGDVARRTTFAPGVGIPGRVWQDRAPIWSMDVVHDPNFVRAEVAAKFGLRTGFAFPIRADVACAGVIKFLTRERLAPDPALLDMLAAVGRDIGLLLQRTRAEAAVRESERQLRRVLDNLFTFVGLLSPEGVVLEVNRAPLEAAGITFADVRGRRFEDCYWWSYAPEVQARLRDGIERAAGGEMVRYDVDVRVAGGRLMAIDFMLAPLRDDDGRITHLIPSAVDITERKRLTEERFQAFLDAAPDAMVVVAADGTIRVANRQAEQLFGYRRAELVGQPVATLMPEHHRAGHEQHLRSYFAAPSARPMGVCSNIVGLTKGGRVVPLDVSLSPVPTAEGTMTVAAVRDITERRKAEEALQASERRFREFMEDAQLICVTLDREARIAFCNQFLLSLTGRRRDEVEGQDWFGLFIPADDHDRIKEVFEQSLARREIVVPPNFENPILTRTGERRLIAWNNVLVHDAAGEVIGITAVGNDVTEQRGAREALEAAKAEAERANALKSRFLAATSHDLRQPLQTLGLLQGVLSRTVRDEGSRGVIQNLGDTIASMASTIDALLDINQLESGAIKPEVIDFPVSSILSKMRSEYAHLAETKDLELRVVPCSAVIHSDPRLLERLVENLVSNAIKYTPAGRVLIGCRRRGGKLRIEVWDTGVGIPAHQLEAIFEEYHQLDNPARERSRGLGLGLTVVQRMAELLGHRIDVRSTLRRGSMFAVEVGLGESRREAAPAQAPEAAAAEPRGISLLLVEDDASVRDSLALLLDLEGYDVMAAMTADEAIATVVEGAARPRILIADRNLPGRMSGVELVGRLKTQFDQTIPAIILTGDASTETMREITESGAEYLRKPVDADSLLKLIGRLLDRDVRPAHTIARTRPSEAPLEPGRRPVISVVDDDAPIRDAIRSLLEAWGYQVETFGTCEAFLASARPERSACLLVDVGMPGMDGLEMQEQLNAQGADIPVVIITGRKDMPLAVRAMRAGAVDFLQKPFANEALLGAVERALAEKTQSADRTEAARRLERLTAREREVMQSIVAGLANKEVALRLGISPRTAENHRARIMHKTGAGSLAELVRLAMAAGVEIRPE